MKDALVLITGWLNNITDVLKALIALGVAIGILFNDPFNVIAGIGSLMSQFGDAGIAGLIALILIVSLLRSHDPVRRINPSSYIATPATEPLPVLPEGPI